MYRCDSKHYARRGDFVRYTSAEGDVLRGYVLSTSVLYRLSGGRTGSIRVEFLGPVHGRFSANNASLERCTLLECFPDLARAIRHLFSGAIDGEGPEIGPDSLPPHTDPDNEGENRE